MRPLVFLLSVVLFGADDRGMRTSVVFSEYSQSKPGCAVGVLQDGEVRWRKGYGLADVEQKVALTPESRFYLASVSKQFTALAALIAEKEGKLSLDDPLSKYLPEMPVYAAKIPLHRMLDHTAGLRDYLTLWDLKGWSNNSVLRPEPTLALIARQQALDFEPGSDHSYSNTGYFLMSVIIERTTGKPLGEYLQEKVFGPLGMTATRVQHDHTEILPNRAHGYSHENGQTRLVDVNFDVMGSGGVYSNIDDMLKWAANFEQPKVAGDLLDRLSTPGKLTDGRETPTGYAFGLRRIKHGDGIAIVHSGGAPGYRTFFAQYPKEKLTVITLCNGEAELADLTSRVADVWLQRPLRGRTGVAVDGTAPIRAKAGDHAPLLGAWWSAELETVWRFVERDGDLYLSNEGGLKPVIASRRAFETVLFTGGAKIEPGPDFLSVSAGRAKGIRFVRYDPKKTP